MADTHSSTRSFLKLPLDGLAGLKQNFKADVVSGFIVFLLALPLSLGIAKASDFPALMGIITAIVGGVVVSFFTGSALAIKGPAAGLIVVVVSAVGEFGGGQAGGHLALSAMVVAGLLQIGFGLLRLGKFSDFFPHSAIHGMMAAIGLLIILKQIPVLLNIDPSQISGIRPLALLAKIPDFILNADAKASCIGLVGLGIMLFWPKLKHRYFRRIPAALLVLGMAIGTQLILDFENTKPAYTLVTIDNLVENLRFNANFDAIYQPVLFVKFVIMFAFVGSLESLLSLKAIDLKDVYKRKSDPNQDLIAIGIGNSIAALLGGLPMISEVARSSSNIENGAKTRWANFFHGLFLLLFVLLGSSVIELIPNSALAAMLIGVGINLAHPSEFVRTFQIGRQQFAVFLVTIFFTIYTDLLVGIGAAVALKIVLHLFDGLKYKYIFKASITVSEEPNHYIVQIEQAAVFSNYLSIKKKLDQIPAGTLITIDFKHSRLIDHSVMESLDSFGQDWRASGGQIDIIGLENHKSLSAHPFATRIKKL